LARRATRLARNPVLQFVGGCLWPAKQLVQPVIAKDAGNLAALLLGGTGVLKDYLSASFDISLPADTINSGPAFPESPLNGHRRSIRNRCE
jgi:hypothetical protein